MIGSVLLGIQHIMFYFPSSPLDLNESDTFLLLSETWNKDPPDWCVDQFHPSLDSSWKSFHLFKSFWATLLRQDDSNSTLNVIMSLKKKKHWAATKLWVDFLFVLKLLPVDRGKSSRTTLCLKSFSWMTRKHRGHKVLLMVRREMFSFFKNFFILFSLPLGHIAARFTAAALSHLHEGLIQFDIYSSLWPPR